MEKDAVTMTKSQRQLKQLIKLMNRQNRRLFPPFKPLRDAFDLVLTDDELRFLLAMGTARYSYDRLAGLGAVPADALAAVVGSLRDKGFIKTEYLQSGEERYTLHAIIVGWFEGQVSYLRNRDEEREFSLHFHDFYRYLTKFNVFPLREIINLSARLTGASNQSVGIVSGTRSAGGTTRIEVNRTVDPGDSAIYPGTTVNDLIREFGTGSVIGQFHCMCRRIADNIGDPCRVKMPDDCGCLGLGDMIRPYIANGQARQVSVEETFDIVQKARDHGAVHTVFHERDDTRLPAIGLCNCCWDCCGIMRTYNMGAAPLRYDCFYTAVIANRDACTGCKKCERYCPTAAISVVDRKATINERKCIGCGQCEHQCPAGAVSLTERRRTVVVPMLRPSEARIRV